MTHAPQILNKPDQTRPDQLRPDHQPAGPVGPHRGTCANPRQGAAATSDRPGKAVMYLLDTNVISELRKPRPHGAVLAWLQSFDNANLHLAAVSLGEIQAGIELTRQQDATKARAIESWLDQLSLSSPILPAVPPPCCWKPAAPIASPTTSPAAAPTLSPSPTPFKQATAPLIWMSPAAAPWLSMAAPARTPPATTPPSPCRHRVPSAPSAPMLPW